MSARIATPRTPPIHSFIRIGSDRDLRRGRGARHRTAHGPEGRDAARRNDAPRLDRRPEAGHVERSHVAGGRPRIARTSPSDNTKTGACPPSKSSRRSSTTTSRGARCPSIPASSSRARRRSGPGRPCARATNFIKSSAEGGSTTYGNENVHLRDLRAKRGLKAFQIFRTRAFLPGQRASSAV